MKISMMTIANLISKFRGLERKQPQFDLRVCEVWFGVVVALLLSGCASVEMAPYTVTSFAEVPLKKNASIRIVANDQSVASIANTMKRAFDKNPESGFSVVDENADYWFVLNGKSQYARGTAQKKFVDKKENESGGKQVVSSITLNYASAAKGVSVAVYEAKTLTPVNYFEIPVYFGENSKGEVCKEAAYDGRFSREILMRLRDAFLTQQKQIMTPVPLEADTQLRSLFAEGGEKFAKDGRKAYDAFLQRYKELGPIELAKLCEALRTNSYKGADADMKLANQHLYLLVMEALTKDSENLAKIRSEQLKILASTDAKGIAEAVPVALARLEYKLANLVK